MQLFLWIWILLSVHHDFLGSEGVQRTHMDASNPFRSKLMTLTLWGDLWTFSANLALCVACLPGAIHKWCHQKNYWVFDPILYYCFYSIFDYPSRILTSFMDGPYHPSHLVLTNRRFVCIFILKCQVFFNFQKTANRLKTSWIFSSIFSLSFVNDVSE